MWKIFGKEFIFELFEYIKETDAKLLLTVLIIVSDAALSISLGNRVKMIVNSDMMYLKLHYHSCCQVSIWGCLNSLVYLYSRKNPSGLVAKSLTFVTGTALIFNIFYFLHLTYSQGLSGLLKFKMSYLLSVLLTGRKRTLVRKSSDGKKLRTSHFVLIRLIFKALLMNMCGHLKTWFPHQSPHPLIPAPGLNLFYCDYITL